MPTPLSSVQQCLTPESSKVLDDAVAVARRRNHAQTTSLHVVSALLALPSSEFREACVRSRFIYSSNRLHSRALELSFGVALDRLPSSHCDDPPISNSLMAAIKRAQAIQRRFSADVAAATAASAAVQTYQQPLSSVKVELQQLILSILDDPIVSRVMADAGFRSNDVKLAIERPYLPTRLFHRPPLFLCNLPEVGPVAASMGDGLGHCSGKLTDVLMAEKKRNPLLLSMVSGAGEGLVREFMAAVEEGVVGEGINGTKVVNLEKDLMGRDAESVKMKLREIKDTLEGCTGPGVLLNLGDLKSLVDAAAFGSSSSFVIFVVSEIARLVGAHRSASKRLWLIATATYEIFMQCQTCYPSMEDDWDLYPLPISSLRPPPRLFPKSSLMESFVPFGGLFANAAELKAPYASTYEPAIYQPQRDKYEAVNSSNKTAAPRAEPDSLPFWLQGANTAYPIMASGSALAKEDNVVLNPELDGLPKKQTDACQQIQNNSLVHKLDTYRSTSCLDFGSLHDVGRKKTATTRSDSTYTAIQNSTQWSNVHLEKVPKQNFFLPIPSVNPESEENQQSKLHRSDRRIDQLQQNCSSGSNTATLKHDAPLPSKIPVTTELALGTSFTHTEEESAAVMHKGHLNGLSNGMAAKLDGIGQNPPHTTHASHTGGVDITSREIITVPWSSLPITKTSCAVELPAIHVSDFTNLHHRKAVDLASQFDPIYFKTLWKDLVEKVGRQSDAIATVCRTIVNCRVGREQRRRGTSLKGDIWLCFLGQDHVGKKKVASALADTLFGGTKNFISVNLSSQGVAAYSNSIFNRQDIDGYDIRFRGKTTVDYIAEEIGKKPLSIIFLENVDRADDLVRSSLSHAIRTGKFSDSHGREVRINNSIIVMTARASKGKESASDTMSIRRSEESVLKAKAWEMQILVESAHKDESCSKHNPGLFIKRRWNDGVQQVNDGSLEMAKRLHRLPRMPFDLNVSLEELEEESNQIDSSYNSNETTSESEEAWIEEFEDLVDDIIEFEPFNFDNLADEVLKQMTGSLHNILGHEATLEIDPRAMDQILAAVWLSDRKGAFDDWVEHVLSKGLLEVLQKHGTAATMVVKLVACQNQFLEEKTPGIYLPAKIGVY